MGRAVRKVAGEEGQTQKKKINTTVLKRKTGYCLVIEELLGTGGQQKRERLPQYIRYQRRRCQTGGGGVKGGDLFLGSEVR